MSLEIIPPKPLFEPKINTAAREALDEHHQKVADLRARIEAARQPVLDLADRLVGAHADLASAEAEHERVCIVQAEAVISGQGAAVDHAEPVAKAQARVDLCRRVIKVLEIQKAGFEHGLRDIELNSGITASAAEELIGAVVAEEADAAFERLHEAREAAAKAEAAWHTLRAYCISRQWFGLAERMAVKFNTTAAPTWETQNHPKWPEFVAELSHDARAQVQP